MRRPRGYRQGSHEAGSSLLYVIFHQIQETKGDYCLRTSQYHQKLVAVGVALKKAPFPPCGCEGVPALRLPPNNDSRQFENVVNPEEISNGITYSEYF